jgi:hypothetical protein
MTWVDLNAPSYDHVTMSLFLRHIARYAAQKFASDPRAKEMAVKAARAVAGEATQIAREEDKARAAGRAVRRAMNKLRGDR